MLTRKTLIIASDLPNHAMIPCTVWTFRVVFSQASVAGQSAQRQDHDGGPRQWAKRVPLVVAMTAHEVYAREIELTFAGCALGDVEYARMVGV